MGAEVTFFYRVSMADCLRSAGLTVHHVHMPIEEQFIGISSMETLIDSFARKVPTLYDKMKSLLSSHDVVALAPGGKFTEGFNNPRSLLTAAVALSLGVPVIILHQSVGPIENPAHRKLLVEVFKHCNLLLIRDIRSLKFLLELAIPPDKLVQCRDVAMAEDYPLPDSTDYDLGINIRCGFNGHVKLEALSRFILRYKELCPNDRILVYSTTWDLSPDVVKCLSLLPCDAQVKMPSYPEYVRTVGRCAVNVSDSWHGCLFSMIADRPVVCCQTGLRTWKLEGVHAPEQEPLKVLPGLISEQDADTVLDSVIAVQKDPLPVLDRQRRIVQYGRKLSEEGWTAVKKIMLEMNPRRHFLSRFFSRLRSGKRMMRVVAILATYNEERFIAACLEHLLQQGIEVYLIDNCSTDKTVKIANHYLNRGLIGIETFPREGIYRWRLILERKEQLAATLDADWFMHVDADEIRLSPQSNMTLAQAFTQAEECGYNTVNFMEFTFIPTLESPDHDHPAFQKTMRWYYPFLPLFPHRLNAWKRQPVPVELAWSGGHQIRFPGLHMYPKSFLMRHYLFLSIPHAIRKFVHRGYDPEEVEKGWHGWRPKLSPELIKLPKQTELRTYLSDDELDPSNPRTDHYLAGLLTTKQ